MLQGLKGLSFVHPSGPTGSVLSANEVPGPGQGLGGVDANTTQLLCPIPVPPPPAWIPARAS